MQKKRIVVTGIGVISPVGVGKTNYWNSLVSGVSGFGRITHFDPTGFDVQIAAEVKGFDVTNWIDRKESRSMDRFVHFGVAAALDAIEAAGDIAPSILAGGLKIALLTANILKSGMHLLGIEVPERM